MIVILVKNVTDGQMDQVLARIAEAHLTSHISKGEETTVIGVVGAHLPPDLVLG